MLEKIDSDKEIIKRRDIEGIIFDLDNVLYDETDYIFAAYHEIASYLSKHKGVNKNDAFTKLVSDFKKKTSMYPRLFNDILHDLQLDNGLLPEILEIYSCAQPEIKLYEGVEDIFFKLKKKYKLGLLTNGNVKTQKNKVKLLGIERLFDEILYARDLGNNNEKPNIRVYEVLLDRLEVKPKNAICVGDNPYIDFIGTKRLGILTVRVLTGEFKEVIVDKEYDADITVNNLKEFVDLIEVD